MFEDIIIIGAAIIAVIIVIGITLFMMFRTIVPETEAHIIMGSSAANKAQRILRDENGKEIGREDIGMLVYSNDPKQSPDGKVKTIYYRWWSWLPAIGVRIKKIDMQIRALNFKDQVTFTEGNAQVAIDGTAFYRITDVITAARRLINMQQFDDDIIKIVLASMRKATSEKQVSDLIKQRESVAESVKKDIASDARNWGIEFTSVVIVEIKDPIKMKADGVTPEVDENGDIVYISHVVSDITKMKESEIAKASRMTVANNDKEALIAEAESRKLSGVASVESEQVVEMRKQEKAQKVAEAEKDAAVKELEVRRTRDQTAAEIQKNVSITNAEATAEVKKKTAEGEKAAAITNAEGDAQAVKVKAEAQKEKLIAEGEGQAKANELIGIADGTAIRARKVGEAEGLLKIAEAATKMQEGAKDIREIEKNERIGIEMAKALQGAEIKLYGNAPASLYDLMNPANAARVGLAVNNAVGAATGNKSGAIDLLRKVGEKAGINDILGPILDDPEVQAVANETQPTPAVEPKVAPKKEGENPK